LAEVGASCSYYLARCRCGDLDKDVGSGTQSAAHVTPAAQQGHALLHSRNPDVLARRASTYRAIGLEASPPVAHLKTEHLAFAA
jgi:hypothetical protein